jgi:anti-sigma B factor antagonist
MPQVDGERSGAGTARPPDAAEFSRRSPTPGVGILTIRGELDIASSGALQQQLNDLLDAGTPRVEVDLSGVVFMDSSALSALVGAHERASKQNQRLALVSPSPACAKVLGITGLDRVFDLS